MKFKRTARKYLNKALKPYGICISRTTEMIDYVLHEYSSYEEYKRKQIETNAKKINNVWADQFTLTRVKDILIGEFGSEAKIKGICHGARNGYEQNFLRSILPNSEIFGTDISETAKNYDNSVQWDFHDKNEDWRGKQDFVYTNSLDQSWQPKVALQTWLSQLKPNGILILEHTEAHGPVAASKEDPFGVKPTVMPYVLTMWFGSQISITHSVAKKSNIDTNAWLFIIRATRPDVRFIEGNNLDI